MLAIQRNTVRHIQTNHRDVTDTGLQHLMRGKRIRPEIVFRHRAHIAGAFRASHDDESLEAQSEPFGSPDGQSDISARANGKQRHLARMRDHIVDEEINGRNTLLGLVGGDGIRVSTQTVIAKGIHRFRHFPVERGRRATVHRDVAPAA